MSGAKVTFETINMNDIQASVPVAIIYSFFVEYYAAGLTAGAVKG